MIRKKGRGGARKGAGRKKVIRDLSWITIGRMCEKLQKGDALVDAERVREHRPVIKKIRKFQALVVTKRASPRQREALWKLGFKNSRVTDWAGPLKARRVATREQICARVSDACFKLGRLRIAPRRVRDCWDRYGQFVRLGRRYVPTEEIDEAGLIAQQTPDTREAIMELERIARQTPKMPTF